MCTACDICIRSMRSKPSSAKHDYWDCEVRMRAQQALQEISNVAPGVHPADTDWLEGAADMHAPYN